VLLSPINGDFGRACLIPNLSYLSEAGASLLDHALGTHIVPYTDLASFSSPSFCYDWIDRHAASSKRKRPKPLPDKCGSLQLFAHGFRDAYDFLNDHPWPDPTPPVEDRRSKVKHHSVTSGLIAMLCGLKRADDVDVLEAHESDIRDAAKEVLEEAHVDAPFTWTPELMNDFVGELQKLVILDVLLRNTDRGALRRLLCLREAVAEHAPRAR
jgi:hypothetical protein